jgi:hypothetical protein
MDGATSQVSEAAIGATHRIVPLVVSSFHWFAAVIAGATDALYWPYTHPRSSLVNHSTLVEFIESQSLLIGAFADGNSPALYRIVRVSACSWTIPSSISVSTARQRQGRYVNCCSSVDAPIRVKVAVFWWEN